MPHIQGISRNQLQVSSLEDSISADNPVRFIDGFFHLQPQEILALCCEKTNNTSAKNVVKTKGSKYFTKNGFR